MQVSGRSAFFLCGEKLGQADKVIGGEVEDKLAAYAFETAQHGLGCKPHSLAPAEGLFNAFADALAYGVSGAPRCAAVDGRALGFRRHMRRYVHGSQLVDEVFGRQA